MASIIVFGAHSFRLRVLVVVLVVVLMLDESFLEDDCRRVQERHTNLNDHQSLDLSRSKEEEHR